jgi:tartrate-resistant acid phosphatase type 5
MRRSIVACFLGGCHAGIPEPPLDQRIEVSRPGDTITFAVIGDMGYAGPDEQAVAELVASWRPDLVITLGDNNYPDGAQETIDANIGQYYHSYIAPYRGRYGEGADVNRFFPTPGNHDWRAEDLAPYLQYFELPGNERYYEITWGPVQFFALDSDRREPDGNEDDSKQARWLEGALARSAAPWQIVYMHHAPYSSGKHGNESSMQWPFHKWGADAVLAGHDHTYERIERPEGVYFVNGLGGNPDRYPLEDVAEHSSVRFNAAHGAMKVEATASSITFSFITTGRETIDSKTLTREVDAPAALPAVAPRPFDEWED